MKKTKLDKAPDQTDLGRSLLEIVLRLAGNPEVYKGTAQDAAKLPRLAAQIIDEILNYSSTEANE